MAFCKTVWHKHDNLCLSVFLLFSHFRTLSPWMMKFVSSRWLSLFQCFSFSFPHSRASLFLVSLFKNPIFPPHSSCCFRSSASASPSSCCMPRVRPTPASNPNGPTVPSVANPWPFRPKCPPPSPSGAFRVRPSPNNAAASSRYCSNSMNQMR